MSAALKGPWVLADFLLWDFSFILLRLSFFMGSFFFFFPECPLERVGSIRRWCEFLWRLWVKSSKFYLQQSSSGAQLWSQNPNLTYVCTLRAWDCCKQQVAPVLPSHFLIFPPTSYPLISLLSPACLCSFVLHFFLDLRSPPLFASSANSSALVHLTLFFFLSSSQPSGPDDVLGPSKDDRTVPSTGWVRRQLKRPQSRAHSPGTPTGLQQHGTSSLKALSHSSLRALYFKHLRDYIAAVINLRGPICLRCDCL